MSRNALESVGRKVFLIKGDKVVGEGMSIIGQSDQFHGVGITGGDLFDQVSKVKPFNHAYLAVKHVYVRFNPRTGEFIDIGFSGEYLKATALFCGVFAVDQFNFEYGLLPDRFKTVEGYGAKKEAWKTDIRLIEVYEGRPVEKGDELTLQLQDVRINDISAKRLTGWLEEFSMLGDLTKIKFTYFFKDKTCLVLCYVGEEQNIDGIARTLQIGFAEHSTMAPEAALVIASQNFPKDYWRLAYTVQSFELWELDKAVNCFVDRLHSEKPSAVIKEYC